MAWMVATGRLATRASRASRAMYFAGTFCKHPLVMAAVGAVLEHVANEGDTMYEALDQLTETLTSELNAWWAEGRACS